MNIPQSPLTKRTVQFRWHADDLAQLEMEVGDTRKLNEAVGYLSAWANGIERYAHCEIAIAGREGEYELVATYRSEPLGAVEYCIGGVWGGEQFSFHS